MMVSLDEGSLHSPSATSDFNDSKEESMDASVENGGYCNPNLRQIPIGISRKTWSSSKTKVIGNDDERNCTSLESADYQGSMDHMGKRYFCQRCLNHGLEFQRKGHKPSCKYATCTCDLCQMVEQRRQINYQLSMWKPDDEACVDIINGRKVRNPKCARCSAHGKRQALRGHKKSTCPFNQCQCDMCALVENRRILMARQIRVRRTQQRQRQQQPSEITTPEPSENGSTVADADVILKPLPRVLSTNNSLIASVRQRPASKKTVKTILGHTDQSAFHPTVSMSQLSLPNYTMPSAGIVSTPPSASANPFSPAQMEFLMKLFMQTSQQPSNFASTNSMNPFLINPQSSNILPSAFGGSLLSSTTTPHPFTGFPTLPSSLSSTSMPSMLHPFLYSCFQGFIPPFSLHPFLSERRPS